MEMTCKTIPEVASTRPQLPASRQTTIIPKSFWVGGLKYGVDLEEILVENGKVIGTVQYANQRIVVDPSLAPIQTTEQSFIHELVHLMFHMCCEIELQRNERLVDVFSQFLYQALTTAEPRPLSDLIIAATKASSQKVVENNEEKPEDAGDAPVICDQTVEVDEVTELDQPFNTPQFSNAPTLEELEACWSDGRESLIQDCIE